MDSMTKPIKKTRPVVRAAASFYANGASRQLSYVVAEFFLVSVFLMIVRPS